MFSRSHVLFILMHLPFLQPSEDRQVNLCDLAAKTLHPETLPEYLSTLQVTKCDPTSCQNPPAVYVSRVSCTPITPKSILPSSKCQARCDIQIPKPHTDSRTANHISLKCPRSLKSILPKPLKPITSTCARIPITAIKYTAVSHKSEVSKSSVSSGIIGLIHTASGDCVPLSTTSKSQSVGNKNDHYGKYKCSSNVKPAVVIIADAVGGVKIEDRPICKIESVYTLSPDGFSNQASRVPEDGGDQSFGVVKEMGSSDSLVTADMSQKDLLHLCGCPSDVLEQTELNRVKNKMHGCRLLCSDKCRKRKLSDLCSQDLIDCISEDEKMTNFTHHLDGNVSSTEYPTHGVVVANTLSRDPSPTNSSSVRRFRDKNTDSKRSSPPPCSFWQDIGNRCHFASSNHPPLVSTASTRDLIADVLSPARVLPVESRCVRESHSTCTAYVYRLTTAQTVAGGHAVSQQTNFYACDEHRYATDVSNHTASLSLPAAVPTNATCPFPLRCNQGNTSLPVIAPGVNVGMTTAERDPLVNNSGLAERQNLIVIPIPLTVPGRRSIGVKRLMLHSSRHSVSKDDSKSASCRSVACRLQSLLSWTHRGSRACPRPTENDQPNAGHTSQLNLSKKRQVCYRATPEIRPSRLPCRTSQMASKATRQPGRGEVSVSAETRTATFRSVRIERKGDVDVLSSPGGQQFVSKVIRVPGTRASSSCRVLLPSDKMSHAPTVRAAFGSIAGKNTSFITLSTTPFQRTLAFHGSALARCQEAGPYTLSSVGPNLASGEHVMPRISAPATCCAVNPTVHTNPPSMQHADQKRRGEQSTRRKGGSRLCGTMDPSACTSPDPVQPAVINSSSYSAHSTAHTAFVSPRVLDVSRQCTTPCHGNKGVRSRQSVDTGNDKAVTLNSNDKYAVRSEPFRAFNAQHTAEDSTTNDPYLSKDAAACCLMKSPPSSKYVRLSFDRIVPQTDNSMYDDDLPLTFGRFVNTGDCGSVQNTISRMSSSSTVVSDLYGPDVEKYARSSVSATVGLDFPGLHTAGAGSALGASGCLDNSADAMPDIVHDSSGDDMVYDEPPVLTPVSSIAMRFGDRVENSAIFSIAPSPIPAAQKRGAAASSYRRCKRKKPAKRCRANRPRLLCCGTDKKREGKQSAVHDAAVPSWRVRGHNAVEDTVQNGRHFKQSQANASVAVCVERVVSPADLIAQLKVKLQEQNEIIDSIRRERAWNPPPPLDEYH